MRRNNVGIAVLYLFAATCLSGFMGIWAVVCIMVITYITIAYPLSAQKLETMIVLYVTFILGGISALQIATSILGQIRRLGTPKMESNHEA